MNNVKTILICLIIIVATCAFCIGLIAMNEQVTTVKLTDTCSIDVIGEYKSTFENGMNQIKMFDKLNNQEYKGIIVYCNSNGGLQEIMTFATFKSIFVGNTYDTGAEPVKTEWNGETVYVTYSSNNLTHDNILIISKNRDECIKMYKSIKYNTNATKSVNNTTTDNTVEHISNNNVQENNNNNNPEELRKVKEDAFNSGRSYQSYLDSRNNKPASSRSLPVNSSR